MANKEKNICDLEDDDFEESEEELAESIEEKLLEENVKPAIKLDYTLETPEERNELVKQIIDQTPPEQLTNRYLEILTDYKYSFQRTADFCRLDQNEGRSS